MLLAALCCAALAEPAANRTALFLELAAAQDTAQRSVAPEPPAPDRGWVGSATGLTAVLGKPQLLSEYKDPNGGFVGWGYPSVIRDAGASAYQMMYQGGVKGAPVGTLFSAVSDDGITWRPVDNRQQHTVGHALPPNAVELATRSPRCTTTAAVTRRPRRGSRCSWAEIP